jgi:hypothetical protein
MGWTTPRTWITGEVVTAAEMNTHIRDNETALQPQAATIATQETTASLTYVDLATSGPTVTLLTGTQVYCTVSAFSTNNTSGDGCTIAVAVSGATTIAAGAGTSAVSLTQMLTAAANQQVPLCNSFILSGLTAGTNTFKLQYQAVLGGTATFRNRTIVVEASF